MHSIRHAAHSEKKNEKLSIIPGELKSHDDGDDDDDDAPDGIKSAFETFSKFAQIELGTSERQEIFQ